MNTTTSAPPALNLEQHFAPFRKNIIGNDCYFDSPDGRKHIIYSDWTASGRMYGPIEERLMNEIAPFVANTHTQTNHTGSLMTNAYHEALEIIKNHVNANADDVIISSGSGMTGVINKLQRILGFRVHEKYQSMVQIPEEDRPIIFCTHMEHHSNQTSWLETIADLEIIQADEDLLVDLKSLEQLLKKYEKRKIKIAAITSCSNVTGIKTPYHEVAAIMHKHNGLCFVDFACSAPYIKIDMHPSDPLQDLDAIYFSPHKFLGGPGTSGILLFNRKLYNNRVPDHPGGGTVDWTNPWGGHKYVDDIEAREDGGTPAFLQTMKAAMCIKLKEEMGIDNILKREKEILDIIWNEIGNIPNLHILAGNIKERLGVVSFYIDGLHYNLGVKLLNDKFGIQVRGGCLCAGTYAHYLFNVDPEYSKSITDKVTAGDWIDKPGWIRMSIHPVMTNDEIYRITQGIKDLAANFEEWSKEYEYQPKNNEFKHKKFEDNSDSVLHDWFSKSYLS